MKRIFIIAFFIMLLFVVGCTSNVVVTFDTQGGNEISPVTVIKGNTVEEPTAPVRGDDEFVGWFLNDVQWDFNNPVNEDITLIDKKSITSLSYFLFDASNAFVIAFDIFSISKFTNFPFLFLTLYILFSLL